MFSPTNAQAVITNFSWKGSALNPGYGLMFTNAIFAAGNTFTRLFRVANTTADTLETIEYDNNGTPVVTEHGLAQATASNVVLSCTLTSNGQILAGLTNTRTYFLRVSNTTLLTLHTNANGALFNSNRANITGFGSGTNTLNIHGLIYAFTNFALEARIARSRICDTATNS